MEKYLVKKQGKSSLKRSKVTEDATEVNGAGAAETEKDFYNSASESKRKNPKTSFVFREIKGDLFAAPETECLAHCISADVRMGKGIAVIFKKKFGGVNELIAQGVKPGGVAVLKRGNRFIYYVVTKEKYWNKPTYKSLQDSLQSMARHCKENSVKELSMPRIGCGLDGLKWDQVRRQIKETFEDLDITVTVYTI